MEHSGGGLKVIIFRYLNPKPLQGTDAVAARSGFAGTGTAGVAAHCPAGTAGLTKRQLGLRI